MEVKITTTLEDYLKDLTKDPKELINNSMNNIRNNAIKHGIFKGKPYIVLPKGFSNTKINLPI